MVFAGEGREAVGDLPQAIRFDLDTVEMAVKIRRGPSPLYWWTSTDIAEMGRAPIYEMVDRLSTSDSISAAKRLEEIDTESPSIKDIIIDEMIRDRSDIIKSSPPTSWRTEVDDSFSLTGMSSFQISQNAFTVISSFLESPAAAYRNLCEFERRVPLQSTLSWPEFKRQWPKTTDIIVRKKAALDLYAIYLAKADSTYDRLLETQLALHAYRTKFGSYPRSLTNLVPDYLSTVPQDPICRS